MCANKAICYVCLLYAPLLLLLLLLLSEQLF
jgi:hypothetical protein